MGGGLRGRATGRKGLFCPCGLQVRWTHNEAASQASILSLRVYLLARPGRCSCVCVGGGKRLKSFFIYRRVGGYVFDYNALPTSGTGGGRYCSSKLGMGSSH